MCQNDIFYRRADENALIRAFLSNVLKMLNVIFFQHFQHKNLLTSNILNLENFCIELQQNLIFEILLQQDVRIFYLFFSLPLSRVPCMFLLPKLSSLPLSPSHQTQAFLRYVKPYLTSPLPSLALPNLYELYISILACLKISFSPIFSLWPVLS